MSLDAPLRSPVLDAPQRASVVLVGGVGVGLDSRAKATVRNISKGGYWEAWGPYPVISGELAEEQPFGANVIGKYYGRQNVFYRARGIAVFGKIPALVRSAVFSCSQMQRYNPGESLPNLEIYLSPFSPDLTNPNSYKNFGSLIGSVSESAIAVAPDMASLDIPLDVAILNAHVGEDLAVLCVTTAERTNSGVEAWAYVLPRGLITVTLR